MDWVTQGKPAVLRKGVELEKNLEIELHKPWFAFDSLVVSVHLDY